MKLAWAVICRRSSVDRDTGLPSAMDIFSRVAIPTGIPKGVTIPLEFSIAIQFKAEKAESPGTRRKIELRMKAGKSILARAATEFTFEESGASTSFFGFSGLPVIGDRVVFEIWDESKKRRVGKLEIGLDRVNLPGNPTQ